MLSVPQGGGESSVGGRRRARPPCRGGAVLCISWQPTQPRCSPGHQPGEAPHRLQAAAIRVQELEVQRPSRRGLEVHRAVGLDRHLGEDPLHALLLHDRHRRAGVAIRLVPGRVGLVVQLEDPQVLDRAPRQVGHALVHVGADRRRPARPACGPCPCPARPRGPAAPAARGRGSDGDRVPDVVDALVDQARGCRARPSGTGGTCRPSPRAETRKSSSESG